MEESQAIKKATAAESSIREPRRLIHRMHYWWSLFVAGALLALLAPPILSVAWLLRDHDLVYPWALFGASWWLRLSGVKVKVIGLNLLDPQQTYVFVANHHSYLDTATLFIHTGRESVSLPRRNF